MSYKELKDRLYESFIQTKERGLTDEQVRLAKNAVAYGKDLQSSRKYDHLQFLLLIKRNGENYMKLINALGLVLQYITDLLSPELPPNWWSISTKNRTYAFRMANMVGIEDIFMLAGYTRKSKDFLTFPEGDKRKPDKQLLAALATEILIAREECSAAQQGSVKIYFDELQNSPMNHQPSMNPPMTDNMPSRAYQSPVMSPRTDIIHQQHYPPQQYLYPGSSNSSSYRHTSCQDHNIMEDSIGFNVQPHSNQYTPNSSGRYTTSFTTSSPGGYTPGSSSSSISSESVDQPVSSSIPPKPKPRTKIFKRMSDGSINSGSSDSSPTQTEKFSGPMELCESFDESKETEGWNQPPESSKNHSGTLYEEVPVESPPPVESNPSSARDTVRRKREAMKKKMEQFRQKQRQKQSGNDPSVSGSVNLPSHYSSPDMSKRIPVSSPINVSSSLDSVNSKPNSDADSVDPSRPVDSRPKLSPIPSSPSNTQQVVSKEDEPMSPAKCPRCQNHLNESSICTYCTIATSPLEQLTAPVLKQRPVPRPRTNVQVINNPPGKAQQPMKNNSGPIARHISGPIPPDISGPIPPDISEHIPRNTSGSNETVPTKSSQELMDKNETLKSSSYGADNSLTSEATLSTLTSNEDNDGKEISSEALDQQFYKFSKEGDHFASLSLEGQDEYLDDKIRYGDTINHLKPHYKGRNWFARKEEAEIVRFRALPLDEQKETIEGKRKKKEKISHLVPYYNISNGKAFEEDERAQRLQYKEKIRLQGQHLCHWIKICAKEGFRPKEVEIAFQQSDNPLTFLQTEWQSRISTLETMFEFNKKQAGQPSREELRHHLIKAKGRAKEAKITCMQNRLTKIKELEEKLAGKLKINRHVLVNCLGQCDLDVEEAFYAVQRTTLLELYKYMISSKEQPVTEAPTAAVATGDGTAPGELKENKGKSDMELMKEKVLETTKDKDKDSHAYQFCVRMLIAENKFKSDTKAVMLINLLNHSPDYPMKYYIDAVRHYDTFDEALSFLNHDCPICMETYIIDDMVVMPACGESLCKHCFIDHFTVTIKEKSVKHFNCPLCGEPDMSNEEQDMNIELLVAMVKGFCEKELYELCQHKLTEFNLSKSPNFVWCINQDCRSGFLTDREDRLRVECPNCHKDMCFLCKKKWEHQHEGLTCDQFTQWKIDNDPEAQKQGLAAHLEEHGIQCPACKFRYDLARGGCMHFRCTQCPVEFCSGCGGHIKKGEDCGKYESCKDLGLHAHHPRDCLFYLRDFSVDELQGLLVKNEVKFDTDPPKAQLDAAREGKKQDQGIEEEIAIPVEGDEEDEDAVLGEPIANEQDEPDKPVELTCCVMLQKEGPEGLYDEKCGKPTPDKMAGLCETHYKEYLVGKINKEKVDPIELYTVFQLGRILEREEQNIPAKEDEDQDDDEYKEKLIEHIKEVLPIQRKNVVNFVPKN